MLNKPVGMIVTTDETKRDNVISHIDCPERIFPVGRLDVKSEGLLLLTNDGVLANRIMHPRYDHDKEYVVKIDKDMPRKEIKVMQNGIKLEDGITLPAKVRQIDPRKFAIILTEGRNRQIRRMCEALGYNVTELKRTRIITLKMPTTYPSGNWRHLTESEVLTLKKAVGVKT
jgi:23S rRNA pseudouridine2604 synthase